MVDYKLRLGDGTTFSVDEKGLTTWLQGGLVDDKARVQPAGSKKWFSIKQVLAAQGTQRGHAIRQTEKGRADVDRQAAEETAEIERKVASQRAAEERKAAEDLATAEHKAAEERSAAERKLIEDREATERYVAEQAAAAEERAAAERAEAEAREASRVADAEQRVAAERAERAERKRQAEEARIEAEQRAAEDARLEGERAAAEQRAAAERRAAEQQTAEQEAAEKRAAAMRAAEKKAAEKQAAARAEAEARETAAREAAREAERVAEAEGLVAAERAERAERKRLEAERLAEQQARLAAQHATERAASERRAAEEREAREREREREAALEMSAFATPDPPATEIAIEPPATMVRVEEFERELGLVPVPFNDDVAAADGGPPPVVPDRVMPPSSDASSGAAGVPNVETPKAVVRLLVRLSQTIEGVVTSVARLFGRPKPLPAPPPLVVAPPTAVVEARVAPPAQAPRPVPQPAPPPWAAPAPVPPPKPIAAPVPSTRESAGVTRQPAVPPPSFQKLEVIPFAAAPVESKAVEDVWGGDDPLQEPSAIASTVAGVWPWVKRVTITTALIVGVALLALNREKWLPGAKDASTYLGQEVDKLSERATTRTVPPAAIAAARAQIPYLRPQTIEMIMARSTAVLEPAEVFRRAHQAVEGARPSLPENVVAEIDNLAVAVAAQLDSTEDEHLRAYLAAIRAGTPTAAYQDKEAVWLAARGARRLPAEKLERMEVLFAQAVSAALQPPKP